MDTKKKQRYIVGAFVAFFILILVQHSYVWLQFDDYGYATLFYARNQSVNGVYTLKNICEYLQWHYLHWGGRVLSFFTEILCLRAGLGFTRVAQSVMILCSLYLSWKILREDNREKSGFLLAILLIGYGLLDKKTLADGVFWFTASFVYFWPYVIFLAAIRLDQIYEKNGNKRLLPLIWLCYFAAGFSQEQTGFAVAGYTVLCMVLPWLMRKKKLLTLEHIRILFAGAGFALVFLAPGNFVRLEENAEFNSLSLIAKIRTTLPIILKNNFGRYNWRFDLFLAVTGMIAALLFFQRGKVMWQKGLAALLGILQLFGGLYIFLIFRKGSGKQMTVLSIWIVSLVVLFLLLFWVEKEWRILAVFLAALATQSVMLVSPSISNRTHLVCELLLHLVISWIWSMAARGFLEKCLWIAGLVAGVMAAANVFSVTEGYREASKIQELNHNKLVEAGMNIRAGEDIRSVELYKLPDDSYVSQMGYQQSFIEIYMREYYGLPSGVVFYWLDEDCSGDFRWSGDHYPDGWLGEYAAFSCEQSVSCNMVLRLYNEGDVTERLQVGTADEGMAEYELTGGSNEISIHLKKGRNTIRLHFPDARQGDTDSRILSVKLVGYVLSEE